MIYELLDIKKWNELPSKGESLIISGMPKSGKSLFSVYLGCEALKSGKKVLHLLKNDKCTLLNYMSNLTDISLEELCSNHPEDRVSDTIKLIQSKYKDNLIVKNCNGINDISKEIERLQKKNQFDMIIMNDMELLFPSYNGVIKAEHIAKEHNVSVIASLFVYGNIFTVTQNIKTTICQLKPQSSNTILKFKHEEILLKVEPERARFTEL